MANKYFSGNLKRFMPQKIKRHKLWLGVGRRLSIKQNVGVWKENEAKKYQIEYSNTSLIHFENHFSLSVCWFGEEEILNTN